jgi:hypothetical protein
VFRLLAPQKAQDDSGAIVQVAGRDRVELLDPDGTVASIEVEFGPVTALYADSLEVHSRGPEPVDPDRRVRMLERMLEGLQAMGGTYEVIPGS